MKASLSGCLEKFKFLDSCKSQCVAILGKLADFFNKENIYSALWFKVPKIKKNIFCRNCIEILFTKTAVQINFL